MGKDLVSQGKDPSFKEISSDRNPASDMFGKASEILGYSLADVCNTGSAEDLNKTVFLTRNIFEYNLLKCYRVKEYLSAGYICMLNGGPRRAQKTQPSSD